MGILPAIWGLKPFGTYKSQRKPVSKGKNSLLPGVSAVHSQKNMVFDELLRRANLTGPSFFDRGH